MKIESRREIVGQPIHAIYKTNDHIEADGYGASDIYIELGNGTVFRLPSLDEPFASEMKENLRETLHVWFSPEPGKPLFISDVLRSESWPTLGLLVSDGRCLVADTWPLHEILEPCLYTPEAVAQSDAVSFWPS